MGGLLNETSGAEPWSYGDKPSVMRAAALMLGRALPQSARAERAMLVTAFQLGILSDVTRHCTNPSSIPKKTSRTTPLILLTHASDGTVSTLQPLAWIRKRKTRSGRRGAALADYNCWPRVPPFDNTFSFANARIQDLLVAVAIKTRSTCYDVARYARDKESLFARRTAGRAARGCYGHRLVNSFQFGISIGRRLDPSDGSAQSD